MLPLEDSKSKPESEQRTQPCKHGPMDKVEISYSGVLEWTQMCVDYYGFVWS